MLLIVVLLTAAAATEAVNVISEPARCMGNTENVINCFW